MVTPKPAYQTLVDGCVLPAYLGGHPALDFCNTRAGRDDRPREYLLDYAHLAAWARGAGLVGDEQAARLRRAAATADAAAELERARTLREACHAALTTGARWDEVASAVHEALAALVLVPGGFELAPADELALPRLAAARAAGELLGSADAAAVGRCPGAGCGWLFLDRAGRRRWCSMAACGNRAKARRHAARARGR